MSDSPEAAAPPAEGAEASPPKKGKSGIVLIGTLVGGLVVGVAAGLFAVGPMMAKSSGYVVPVGAESDSAAAEGEGGEEGGGGGGEHEAPAGGEHGEAKGEGAAASVHLIDNLVLNPAGSGGTRFLMMAAAIEFANAKHVEELKARDAEARDMVLRVMGARSVEELADMTKRDAIRQELADSITTLFPKKERKKAIKRVYFPQFVIQ